MARLGSYVLTAPWYHDFFRLCRLTNHVGERERKKKIIALSRVKRADCDYLFFFLFFSFPLQGSGSCLSSTRLVETEEGGKRAFETMPRSFFIVFWIVNCNFPDDRMDYNGIHQMPFPIKKFLNVSRLITRETSFS